VGPRGHGTGVRCRRPDGADGGGRRPVSLFGRVDRLPRARCCGSTPARR
jgi:hypothetical protein